LSIVYNVFMKKTILFVLLAGASLLAGCTTDQANSAAMAFAAGAYAGDQASAAYQASQPRPIMVITPGQSTSFVYGNGMVITPGQPTSFIYGY
jgi:hypothetical protein